MKTIALSLLCAAAFPLWAQDQFAVRLNHTGVVEVMRMALQHNQQSVRGAIGFQIPAGVYPLKVRRADLPSNPLIQTLSEIVDVDFRRDYDFFMRNARINVAGRVDIPSVRTTVSNQSATGFDLRVVFSVPELTVRTAEVALCETRRGSGCGEGLQGRFRNPSIALRRGSVVRVTADFRATLNDDTARLRLVRTRSNLGTRQGPSINLELGTIELPPVTMIINGQELPMDMAPLRAQVQNYRTFLAHKMLGFAADFIAEDLAAVVNKALRNQCLPTRLTVLEIDPAAAARTPLVAGAERHPDFMAQFQRDLARLVKSMRFDLGLKTLRTPESKHLEIRGDGSLRLNGTTWQVGSTLSNGARPLPVLSLVGAAASDELAVAVGEPVINAGLALLNQQGVFQQVINEHVDVGGVHVEGARAYFKSVGPGQDRIQVVANLRLNLREIRANGILSWIRREIAVWLERNNNDANLVFPLQFEVIPRVVTVDATSKLFLRVDGPFTDPTTFRNDYQQPNNVGEATKVVRQALVDELKAGLGSYVDREFELPLDEYLSVPGVKVAAKDIKIIDSAYLVVTGDLAGLDFARLPQGGSLRACQ
jgi:hypothetical protein